MSVVSPQESEQYVHEKYKKLVEIKMMEHQMKMEQMKAQTMVEKYPPVVPDMWKTIMQIQKDHIETQAKLIASLEEQMKQYKSEIEELKAALNNT